MLSKSSKYAIKAVLFLALNSSKEKKVMVKDLSKPINVPQAYIAKLLQILSRENVISSTKGPKGGFYLSDENKKQSLNKIIQLIDDEKKITSCLLSLESCDTTKPCPFHNMAAPLRAQLFDSLENKTIYDLARDIKEGKSFLPL